MRTRQPIVRGPAAVLAALTLAAAACSSSKDADPKYNDGDTGAAAPATQQTLSPNPAMGDSTQGLQDRTGQPGTAGVPADTTGKGGGSPKRP